MYIIQSFNLTSHDVIVYEGQNIRVVFQLREEHSEESLNIISANLYSYLLTLPLTGLVPSKLAAVLCVYCLCNTLSPGETSCV